ncbi:MAG: hypothetical protein SGPRY_008951, partial [Prymnesium sp.]
MAAVIVGDLLDVESVSRDPIYCTRMRGSGGVKPHPPIWQVHAMLRQEFSCEIPLPERLHTVSKRDAAPFSSASAGNRLPCRAVESYTLTVEVGASSSLLAYVSAESLREE